jgi:flagellar biosynthesis protein FlhG
VSLFQSGAARTIAVASGKGGVGKTNVSVNLSVALAKAGQRTLLLDCDMGLANAGILLGLDSPWTIGDVLAGRCGLDDLIMTGPAGLAFAPGHSGTGSGSTLSHDERGRLFDALAPHRRDFDTIVIDTGSGIEASALALIAAADTPVIVVAPEPTSFVDAYALVKALHVAHGLDRFEIVTNMVQSEAAGHALFDRFRAVATRFLDMELVYAGAIPADPYVREAVLRKRCVVEAFPGAPATRAFARLASRYAAPDPHPKPDPVGELHGAQ